MSLAKANGWELGEKCRSCMHLNAWHVEGHDNEKEIPCESPVGLYDSGETFLSRKRCNCLKFIPADNLKYLEYKYEQSK